MDIKYLSYNNVIKKTYTIVLIILCMMFGVFDQIFAQTVTNVTAKQERKAIHVSYDLDKQADITLFVSTDDGSTYTQLYRVSGDVGEYVSAGHKTIVWDVLAERENLVGDNIVFKVRAQCKDNLTFTVNGVTFKMVYVEGGTFTMGCTSEQGDDCWDAEKPSHSVTVSDFWLGETEVTQALWKAVMGTTISQQRNKANSSRPLLGEGSSYPMYYVSWNEAVVFCNELNSKLSGQLPSGCRFALPSEAQWEYAARGGNKSRGNKYAGSNSPRDVAWYDYNSSSATHPVKSKQPNELGLYDMSGNVWEWCLDWYGFYSSLSQTNPTGPSSGLLRVLCGGSWVYSARYCRVSSRYCDFPDLRNSFNGFRISIVH